MNVSLREVDSENFRQCINLKVADGQEKFVASNVMSIAQSKIYPYLVPLAVYSKNEIVGFLMYERDPETGKFWLARLMIDAQQQGKGYGKSATRALIEKLTLLPDCEEIFLSFVSENIGAEKLYLNLGFKKTGETSKDGETIMRFVINKSTDNRPPTTDN